MIRCEKTDEFLDTNIYCRSDELIEGTFYSFILSFLIISFLEEGIEWRRNQRRNSFL